MGIRICLDEVLKKKGMTSKELCRQVGITEANLSVLRSGKANGIRLHTMNILKFDGNLDEEEGE